MNLGEIKSFLGEDWDRVQKVISESVKSDIDLLDATNAMILSHSGKQIRPLLSLLVARACSDAPLQDASFVCAASAELLHNATLLHDDVADASEQRRGNPTIMSLMGPSVSVLIGDFWLVKAMEGILSCDRDGVIIRTFSKTLSDLAEGEMLQLEKARSGDTDEDDYLKIVFNKTASLFRATAVSAAIAAGAPAGLTEAMGQYASYLGIAFQIRDDIFDYSPAPKTGKPAGVDILEQKITLPLLGALSRSGEAEAARIRGMVSRIGDHPEYRDEIIAFARANGGMEYAEEKLDRYIDMAVGCIGMLRESREKEYLKELAYFVGERKS